MAATWAGHMVDGFDNALAADTSKRYFSGTSGVQVATANTRFNRGYAMEISSLVFDAGGNHSTWRWAGALHRTSGPYNFVALVDSGYQIIFKLTSGGSIEVYRGALATLLGTATSVIPASTWLWVEVLVTIHSSAGVVKIFVSNTSTPVLSLINQNTQATGNAYANQVWFAGDTTLTWDDSHISYGSGTIVDADALPDSTIVTDFALTQGDYSDFTPDSGTNHVNRVRDATAGTLADGDTTYLSSNTATNKEAMLFDDLPADVTDIYLVQITAEVRKNDAAARTVKLGTRRAGTTTEQASATNATDTYQFKTFAQTLDPNTAAAWTRTNVNNTQGLVELIS